MNSSKLLLNTLIVIIIEMVISNPVYSFSTYVSPGMPTETDEITVIVEGGLTGGAKIIDSGATVTKENINVKISIEPCTDSICPVLYEHITMRFPCGKLSEGNYDIITFIFTIYDTSHTTPDTVTEIDTTSFKVYSSSDPIPRIAGFYVSDRGWKDDYEYNYFYKNGDTLSIVAVFEEHCCALFVADFIQIDDTLLVTVQDTGRDECDCGQYRFYITVAIANVDIQNPNIRIVRKDVYGGDYISSFVADTSKPAVCINLQDSTATGFRLFIDSTWFEYEINSPFINGAELLRFQPNPYFSAFDANYLYLDDIILINTNSSQVVNADTIEDFENYVEKEWNLVKFRDGSQLEIDAISTDSSNVFKLTYLNSINGGCSNYIWKLLKSQGKNRSGNRILIHASLIPPESSTPLAGGFIYSRTPENGINVTPNPFRFNSRIRINMPETFNGDRANLSIINLQGQEIRSIELFRENNGDNIISGVWDGLDYRGQYISSGNYIVKVSCEGMSLWSKIVLKK